MSTSQDTGQISDNWFLKANIKQMKTNKQRKYIENIIQMRILSNSQKPTKNFF